MLIFSILSAFCFACLATGVTDQCLAHFVITEQNSEFFANFLQD